MAKVKVQTLQEKRAAEQAAALETMKIRLAEIREQKRLMEEQLAQRSQEEIDAENARWQANHQIKIETFKARRQEVERHPYVYRHEDDEE